MDQFKYISTLFQDSKSHTSEYTPSSDVSGRKKAIEMGASSVLPKAWNCPMDWLKWHPFTYPHYFEDLRRIETTLLYHVSQLSWFWDSIRYHDDDWQ